MKCNFKNPNVKDIFKARLRGEPLHFGFIPLWERKKFVKFCIAQNLIEKIPGCHATSYKVNHVFAYKGTLHKTAWRAPVGCLIELFADIFNISSNSIISCETIVVEHRGASPLYDRFNYIQVREGWAWGRWLVF